MAATKTKNGQPKNRLPELQAPKQSVMTVPALQAGKARIEVVGTTNLLVHRFSEKARKQIEDKQQKEAKAGRDKRDPDAEFYAAMYIISGNPKKKRPAAVHGIPAAGFKKAMVRAGKGAGCVMTDLMCAFHVVGDSGTDLVRLEFEEVRRHDGTVRLPNKSADMRYRPEYVGWRVWLNVSYNYRLISLQQLVNLCKLAGFGVGICEWRPEKGGQFGMYEIGQVEDLGIDEM